MNYLAQAIKTRNGPPPSGGNPSLSYFSLESISIPAMVGDTFCFIKTYNYLAQITYGLPEQMPSARRPLHFLDLLRDYVKISEADIFSFFYHLYGEIIQTILTHPKENDEKKNAYALFELMKKHPHETVSFMIEHRDVSQLELREANNEIKKGLDKEAQRNLFRKTKLVGVLETTDLSEAEGDAECHSSHLVRLAGIPNHICNAMAPSYVDIHCSFKFVDEELIGTQAMIPKATERMLQEQGRAWQLLSQFLYHSMSPCLNTFESSFENFVLKLEHDWVHEDMNTKTCLLQLEKLQRLVDFFREIHKAEKNDSQRNEIDIDQLIDGLGNWDNLQRSISAGGTHRERLEEAKTEVRVEKLMPPFFYHRSLLEICCGELYLNSLKYCNEEKGEILIRAEYDRDTALFNFIFENNGEGIDERFADKIFHPEYGRGTGFGLALIKWFTEMIKGFHIRLDSPKNPTRFVLSVKGDSHDQDPGC